jgi:hypothetical protein
MDLPFRLGLRFGTRYRSEGWGQGLTILGCMNNLLEYLDEEQKPRALYHGLSAVATNTAMSAPHFSARSLPTQAVEMSTLRNWFRRFIEVRDTLGAERVIISALRAGADDKQMADMLFAAATDHRYIQIGHVLDFINKAFECLDVVGWGEAEEALASLAPILADASRQEESIEWRSPIDLVEILEQAFAELPSVLAGAKQNRKADFENLVPILLDDNPQAIVDALMQALRDGVHPEALAGVVAYSAALRIAQFHSSNEFGDWDTALHTFTFANAVHSGLRRVNSPDLLRGVFDAAMSVYLDRFLNIPAAKIPEVQSKVDNPASLLAELETLLNLQQQVNEAAMLVAKYLHSGGDANKLMATLGKLLLREDRDFHTIQCIEAAFRQYSLLKGSPYADKVLIAASRYLAAHAPTMRSQGQTYQIALRLSRGENLFEG